MKERAAHEKKERAKMASEQEYPKERAALLADWRQRLKNQQEADHALFMHVNDLEPGVLVIEQLQQQLAQARAKIDHLQDELLVSLREREKLGGQVGVVACLQEELAQAREALEAWPAKWAHTIDSYSQLLAEARAENAQARALLEKAEKAFVEASYPNSIRYLSGQTKLVKAIRAFLAREEGE